MLEIQWSYIGKTQNIHHSSHAFNFFIFFIQILDFQKCHKDVSVTVTAQGHGGSCSQIFCICPPNKFLPSQNITLPPPPPPHLLPNLKILLPPLVSHVHCMGLKKYMYSIVLRMDIIINDNHSVHSVVVVVVVVFV